MSNLFAEMLGIGGTSNVIGEVVEHGGVRYRLLVPVPSFTGAFLGLRENDEGQFVYGSPVHLVQHQPTRIQAENEGEAGHRKAVLDRVVKEQPRDTLKPGWKPSAFPPPHGPDRTDYVTAWEALLEDKEGACPKECGARGVEPVERDEEGKWPPLLDMLCPSHREMAEVWIDRWGYTERRLASDPLWTAPKTPPWLTTEEHQRWERQMAFRNRVRDAQPRELQQMGFLKIRTNSWGALLNRLECSSHCPAHWSKLKLDYDFSSFADLFADTGIPFPHHLCSNEEFLAAFCGGHRAMIDAYVAETGDSIDNPVIPTEE